MADRVAHELRNPLNGLAVNLEVVRSRSARPGVEGAALVPYAEAASSELERTLPLIDALLSLARPAAVPVDLQTTLAPLLTLYGSIAAAAGGSLRISNDAEQMFVAGDGISVRALLAELLDASVQGDRSVTGAVRRDGDRIALELSVSPVRPIDDDVQRLCAEARCRLTLHHDVATLMFPALTHSGVDSQT